MSGQLAQIGMAGQAVDVFTGGDVDVRTGRLLTVAELQRALAAAVSPVDDPDAHAVRPRGRPADQPEQTADTAVRAAAPLEPERRDWGGTPVPVTGMGQRPLRVDVPALAERPGRHRSPVFPVSQLLQLPPADRARHAARVVLAPWPGPRAVMIGSLAGGTGRSTTAAALGLMAAGCGAGVLLLDAAGEAGSELAARAGTAPSRRPWIWARNAAEREQLLALRRRAVLEPGRVSVVALAGADGGPCPPDAAARAAAAATRCFPLVVLDLPSGPAGIRAALRPGGADLLVVLCRADPGEFGDVTDLLRELADAGAGVDCGQRAVIAVRAGRRGLPRPVRRRLPAAADVAAGVLPVAHVPRLDARGAAVTGADTAAVAGLLAAAVAVLAPVDRHGQKSGHRP